jgi:carboxymethylenebutenolidase
MGSYHNLISEDGFSLSAFRTDPATRARGGIVVLQEIFGVNHHIRSICSRLSEAGYTALAPALFDRIEPGFDVGYSPEENQQARSFISRLDWSCVKRDTQAAIAELKKEGEVAVIGFCFGGTVAFVAATRIPGLIGAVSFYGGRIINYADKLPLCATQMHFGEHDDHIPVSDVEEIRQKRRESTIYIYSAGHGFNCDERQSFDAECAAVAWERTLEFLAKNFSDKSNAAE